MAFINGDLSVAVQFFSFMIDRKYKISSINGSMRLIWILVVIFFLFSRAVAQTAELRGATEEELQKILGRSRAKKGMFEGDLEEGELEIGQVSALIKDIKPAAEVVKEIWEGYKNALQELGVRS